MLDDMTEDAQALLWGAQDIHAECHGLQTFTRGTHVPLEAAAERIGIHLGRSRYEAAIEELEYEGAIHHHRVRLGDAAGGLETRKSCHGA